MPLRSDPDVQSPSGDEAQDPVVDFLIACGELLDATCIVEAGTFKGRTAIALARYLRNAMVFTADTVDRGVREYALKHGYANLRFYLGRFEDMLKGIPGEIDIAFIDASDTKTGECPRWEYAQLAYPRLRVGGLIVVDDTAATDWPNVQKIRGAGNLFFANYHGISVIQKDNVRTEL